MKFFLTYILLSNWIHQIDQSPQSAVLNKIKNAVKNETSPFHHASYKRLAYIVDTFGPRLWGSLSEQLAINELYEQSLEIGFDQVKKDYLDEFRTWKRGEESLTLYSPRPTPQNLNVIGLGSSVPGDIKGEVLVVKDFQELKEKQHLVNGKIVCFNQDWVNYLISYKYRTIGPSRAAQFGAIAVLVRSITPISHYSPHTGYIRYDEQYPKIPAAAITIEDAQMFQRMQDRGQLIYVHLQLKSQWYKSNSSNLLAEVRGTKYPEEILLFGGHIDSWDVGSQTGANDDGGGFIICFEALKLIKQLELNPKRTIRFIAWSGEEMGTSDNGAEQYALKHSQENHIIAFESDIGTTKLEGFGFTGSHNATYILNQKLINSQIIKDLMKKYMPELIFVENSGWMPDTAPLGRQGVPMLRNIVKDNENYDFYFTYHHSAADSMTIMNADDLDDNVIGLASLFYLIADLEESLPKN